jgi:hypothetical protein
MLSRLSSVQDFTSAHARVPSHGNARLWRRGIVKEILPAALNNHYEGTHGCVIGLGLGGAHSNDNYNNNHHESDAASVLSKLPRSAWLAAGRAAPVCALPQVTEQSGKK